VGIVKVRVNVQSPDSTPIVPVVIPDLDEVRALAAKLHAKGKGWKGEALGWQAEYHPERPDPPLDSQMTFTPADFCLGESGIGSSPSCGSMATTQSRWSFSMRKTLWRNLHKLHREPMQGLSLSGYVRP